MKSCQFISYLHPPLDSKCSVELIRNEKAVILGLSVPVKTRDVDAELYFTATLVEAIYCISSDGNKHHNIISNNNQIVIVYPTSLYHTIEDCIISRWNLLQRTGTYTMYIDEYENLHFNIEDWHSISRTTNKVGNTFNFIKSKLQ
ncbi:hypothetical protein OC7_07245 [Vibrio cyclitrophicus ZF270]|nr:hypothetical protein OC7_07245 [Vibrio cyclitrophicus ZF270]